MSKPSFLMRGWSQLRQARGRLGNKVKAGDAVDAEREMYKQASEALRDASTEKKHAEWQRLYDDVYGSQKKANLDQGMPDKKARFQAHLSAKSAVMTKFNVGERNVRKYVTPYE